MTRAEKDMLETLVDHYTLEEVVGALAEIAGDKAEHLRSAWQDEDGGRMWDADAAVLSGVTLYN